MSTHHARCVSNKSVAKVSCGDCAESPVGAAFVQLWQPGDIFISPPSPARIGATRDMSPRRLGKQPERATLGGRENIWEVHPP
jgi:hypothetical protein